MSCLGCAKWINNYNSCYHTRWSTSGTHGKIYPWGFFESEDEITDDLLQAIRRFHSEVRDVFAYRCETRFGLKHQMNSANSDSSIDDISANFEFAKSPLNKAKNLLGRLRGS